MIENLKNDDVIAKVGGRFKLTALIQKRWLQLMRGARPMIETEGMTNLEVVVQEIMDGKIEAIVWDNRDEEDEEHDQ